MKRLSLPLVPLAQGQKEVPAIPFGRQGGGGFVLPLAPMFIPPVIPPVAIPPKPSWPPFVIPPVFDWGVPTDYSNRIPFRLDGTGGHVGGPAFQTGTSQDDAYYISTAVWTATVALKVLLWYRVNAAGCNVFFLLYRNYEVVESPPAALIDVTGDRPWTAVSVSLSPGDTLTAIFSSYIFPARAGGSAWLDFY